MSENELGPTGAVAPSGTPPIKPPPPTASDKFSIDLRYHYEIDPATITPEYVKQITDSVVADVANAIAGHRGGASGGFSKDGHTKASGFIKTAIMEEA